MLKNSVIIETDLQRTQKRSNQNLRNRLPGEGDIRIEPKQEHRD